jgi:two-component system sensor histidine kinase MtrB
MERPAVASDAAGAPAAPAQPPPAAGKPVPAAAPPPRDLRDVREAWEMSLRRKKWVRWLVSWLPQRLTYGIRALLRFEHLVIGKVRLRWRRSLQLRVVGTTLVISAIMVAVIGFFLTEQIAGGLLNNAEASDREQVLTGLSNARSASGLTVPPASGQAANQFIYSLDNSLQPTTNSAGSYSVAVGVNPELALQPGYSPWASTFDTNDSLPASLLTSVEQEQKASNNGTGNQLFYASTTLYSSSGGSGTPAIAFGVPLSSSYQLYFVFPLDEEQQTLQLVQTTLVGAGIALVVLLAAIASLVTRWVVLPVRHAARAAQRLSAGQLEERMTVGGADDLAALATSFNHMAETLQAQLRELQELSNAQRQFVSDVSHELRTPMTTIRMAAEILFESREDLDAAAARSAELLQSQIERFETLLTDLLEISRHDANVAALDAEPADLCDIVRGSADDAQQLAERRGCRIEFRLPAQACIAEVDRRRVERILRNLLVNAVEHGEGRDVVVTVAGDSDAVAVAVRDHGVGLRPGEEQLVFERFWRADPSRARTVGGTGLGLAISLEDARLHGGWLQAWGERGKGAVFRLTVPRLAGQPLAGSPLPLGPDEADVVASAVTTLEADLSGGSRA